MINISKIKEKLVELNSNIDFYLYQPSTKIEYDILNCAEYLFVLISNNVMESEKEMNNNIDCDYIAEMKKLSTQALSAFNRYLKKISNVNYSFIQLPNNSYRIIIPPLLNRRSSGKKAYSVKSKYTNFILSNLLLENRDVINKLDSATVFFISHQSYQSKIIRDNDNSDAHDAINLISKFMMSSDDNGLRLSVFYDSILSDDDNNYTEVIVTPKINVNSLIIP